MKTFYAGKTAPANCSVPAAAGVSASTTTSGAAGGGNNVNRLNPASSNTNSASAGTAGARIAEYRESTLSPSLNLSGQPAAAAVGHSQSRSSSNGSSTPPSPTTMMMAEMESPTEAEAYETPGVSPSPSMISALEYQHPHQRCERALTYECDGVGSVLRTDPGSHGAEPFLSCGNAASRSRVRRRAVR